MAYVFKHGLRDKCPECQWQTEMRTIYRNDGYKIRYRAFCLNMECTRYKRGFGVIPDWEFYSEVGALAALRIETRKKHGRV